MTRTTIKVSTDVRDRVRRLAELRGMSQHGYLDQLLKRAEEDEFWRRMAEVSADEYDKAVADDGDTLDEDYSLEEQILEAEEHDG